MKPLPGPPSPPPRKPFRSGEPADTHLVDNGTFFDSMNFPHFGYSERRQLSDRNDRRKYNLPDIPRMAPIDDMIWSM